MGPYEPPDFHDPDNPYAPPQSAFAPAPIAPLQAGMPFTAVDVLNRSWEIYKARMGDCMAIFWGTYVINLAVSLGANFLIQIITLTARDSAPSRRLGHDRRVPGKLGVQRVAARGAIACVYQDRS